MSDAEIPRCLKTYYNEHPETVPMDKDLAYIWSINFLKYAENLYGSARELYFTTYVRSACFLMWFSIENILKAILFNACSKKEINSSPLNNCVIVDCGSSVEFIKIQNQKFNLIGQLLFKLRLRKNKWKARPHPFQTHNPKTTVNLIQSCLSTFKPSKEITKSLEYFSTFELGGRYPVKNYSIPIDKALSQFDETFSYLRSFFKFRSAEDKCKSALETLIGDTTSSDPFYEGQYCFDPTLNPETLFKNNKCFMPYVPAQVTSIKAV